MYPGALAALGEQIRHSPMPCNTVPSPTALSIMAGATKAKAQAPSFLHSAPNVRPSFSVHCSKRVLISTFLGAKSAGATSAIWNTFAKTAEPAAAAAEIRTPNVVGFTTEDGKQHTIQVPEGRYDEVVALVKAKNYSALVAFN
jgi:hypothetical protein